MRDDRDAVESLGDHIRTYKENYRVDSNRDREHKERDRHGMVQSRMKDTALTVAVIVLTNIVDVDLTLTAPHKTEYQINEKSYYNADDKLI